ncbi:hypothetical protein BDW69DRAFT_179840 [Aspergillus filifer]
MKASTILGTTAALFLGTAMAQVTITIPGLPDLPSISIPTMTIPTSISIPSLPSFPTTIPSCIPVPTIPTLTVPTFAAETNVKRSMNEEFDRMHPRQMGPMNPNKKNDGREVLEGNYQRW